MSQSKKLRPTVKRHKEKSQKEKSQKVKTNKEMRKLKPKSPRKIQRPSVRMVTQTRYTLNFET